MNPPRRLVEPGGPAYKLLVWFDHARLGTLLVCVVVPFPPGAEPPSDVLDAAAVAANADPGQFLAAPEGRRLRTGAPVAFVVRSGMPPFLGRVGEIATLPVFLGVFYE